MTWDELAKAIEEMTPEERKHTVFVFDTFFRTINPLHADTPIDVATSDTDDLLTGQRYLVV